MVAQKRLPSPPAKMTQKRERCPSKARYPAGIITSSDGTGKTLDSSAIKIKMVI